MNTEVLMKNGLALQVVSSAIMNAPPPAGVVSILHTCSNAHMSGIDKATKEKMVRKAMAGIHFMRTSKRHSLLYNAKPSSHPTRVVQKPGIEAVLIILENEAGTCHLL